MDTPHRFVNDDGEVPPLGSWKRLYLAVFIYTAVLIALLYVATRLLDTSIPQ